MLVSGGVPLENIYTYPGPFTKDFCKNVFFVFCEQCPTCVFSVKYMAESLQICWLVGMVGGNLKISRGGDVHSVCFFFWNWTSFGPQNHENWRFWALKIWVITPKIEGCGFSWLPTRSLWNGFGRSKEAFPQLPPPPPPPEGWEMESDLKKRLVNTAVNLVKL